MLQTKRLYLHEQPPCLPGAFHVTIWGGCCPGKMWLLYFVLCSLGCVQGRFALPTVCSTPIRTSVNTFRSGDVGSSLVQLMAWGLLGPKRLPELMTAYHQLDHQKETVIKNLNQMHILKKKMHLKMSYAKCQPFCSGQTVLHNHCLPQWLTHLSSLTPWNLLENSE